MIYIVSYFPSYSTDDLDSHPDGQDDDTNEPDSGSSERHETNGTNESDGNDESDNIDDQSVTNGTKNEDDVYDEMFNSYRTLCTDAHINVNK